jgi:hypothetical protein
VRRQRHVAGDAGKLLCECFDDARHDTQTL